MATTCFGQPDAEGAPSPSATAAKAPPAPGGAPGAGAPEPTQPQPAAAIAAQGNEAAAAGATATTDSKGAAPATAETPPAGPGDPDSGPLAARLEAAAGSQQAAPPTPAGTARPEQHTGPAAAALATAPAAAAATEGPELALEQMKLSIEDGLLMVLGPEGDPVPPHAFGAAAAAQPDTPLALPDGTSAPAFRVAAVLGAQLFGRLGAAEDGDGWILAMLREGEGPAAAPEEALRAEQAEVSATEALSAGGPNRDPAARAAADPAPAEPRIGPEAGFGLARAPEAEEPSIADAEDLNHELDADAPEADYPAADALISDSWLDERLTSDEPLGPEVSCAADESCRSEASPDPLESFGDQWSGSDALYPPDEASDPDPLLRSDAPMRSDVPGQPDDQARADEPLAAEEVLPSEALFGPEQALRPDEPTGLEQAFGPDAPIGSDEPFAAEEAFVSAALLDAEPSSGPPHEPGSDEPVAAEEPAGGWASSGSDPSLPPDEPSGSSGSFEVSGAPGSDDAFEPEDWLEREQGSWSDEAGAPPPAAAALRPEAPSGDDAPLGSEAVPGTDQPIRAEQPEAASWGDPPIGSEAVPGTDQPVRAEQPEAAQPGAARDAEIDPDSMVLVVMRGVPEGATLSTGIRDEDGSWSISPLDLQTVTIELAGQGEGTEASGERDLNITGIAFGENGELVAISETVPLADYLAAPAPADPAAERCEDTAPASPSGGAPGQRVAPLEIDLRALAGETFDALVIRGVPSGARLSAGAYDPAIAGWVLRPQDLSGLALVAPADLGGEVSLTLLGIALRPGSGSGARALTGLNVNLA